MRLKAARVRSYRSIRDSGLVEIESGKTILVGPNEAGKTVFLQALQQVNPPTGVPGFDALRDYPRSEYNDITTGRIAPKDVTVVEAHFALDDEDRALLPTEFQNCAYVSGRRLDNTQRAPTDNAPPRIKFKDIQKDLIRLAAHADARVPPPQEGTAAPAAPSARLDSATSGFDNDTQIGGDTATKVTNWLKETLPHVDENDSAEISRYNDRLEDEPVKAMHGTRFFKSWMGESPYLFCSATTSGLSQSFTLSIWHNASKGTSWMMCITTTATNVSWNFWGLPPGSYPLSEKRPSLLVEMRQH